MMTVGVRELRQNLSKYLDRVKAGESLEVTEHGTVVARLSPSGRQISAAQARLLEQFPGTQLATSTESFRELAARLHNGRQAPAGTVDAFLDESRRDRF